MEKNVVAVIGPQSSGIGHVISHIVNELHVPLLSFAATDPTLSTSEYPYFLRSTLSDYFQMHAVASIVDYYQWKEVAAIFVDDDYGRGGVSARGDALAAKRARISYKAAIPPDSNTDVINDVLFRVNMMESRVLVVHVNPDAGMRIFSIANKLVIFSIGTALGELPPYFISRAARLSGSESEAVKELDATASKEDGPISSTLNRTKHWLLSHSQHLNFFAILILASVPNPLFDLAGIMCGQFGIPFWEFFFATLIGKAIIKTHIQGMILLWDTDSGLAQLDKYLHSNDTHVVAGALLGIGIVACGVKNDCDPAHAILMEYISKDDSNIRIGAILGLGVAYAGSQKDELRMHLSSVLGDSQSTLEILVFTAIALGLVFVGSSNEEIAQSIIFALMERSEAELAEPIICLLPVALGLLYLGKHVF